jgi:hypothetical protein
MFYERRILRRSSNLICLFEILPKFLVENCRVRLYILSILQENNKITKYDNINLTFSMINWRQMFPEIKKNSKVMIYI